MSKISIIIPIYNVEKYLRECLDSVVSQTFKDIEVICVNDGSKDSSLAIINEYAKNDNRVVVVDKENGGYASAINKGLELATGEYIGIVESDDYCAPKMYEHLFNKINGTIADYVIGDFYFLSEKKTKISAYSAGLIADENGYFNLCTNPRLLDKPAYPWKALYRKSFLDNNGIKMLQDGKGAYEDQPWNMTCLVKAKNIMSVAEPLYYYRVDANGSSTNNGGQKLTNYIRRRQQAKEILVENGYFDNLEIREYFYSAALKGCYFFYKKIAPEFKPEYYNLMQELLKTGLDEGVSLKYLSKKHQKRYMEIATKLYEYHSASWLKKLFMRG